MWCGDADGAQCACVGGGWWPWPPETGSARDGVASYTWTLHALPAAGSECHHITASRVRPVPACLLEPSARAGRRGWAAASAGQSCWRCMLSSCCVGVRVVLLSMLVLTVASLEWRTGRTATRRRTADGRIGIQIAADMHGPRQRARPCEPSCLYCVRAWHCLPRRHSDDMRRSACPVGEGRLCRPDSCILLRVLNFKLPLASVLRACAST